MLANALAQVPVLALSKRTTDVLLDANFECFLDVWPTHCDANVLRTCCSVGDAVHRMLGVLASFAFGLLYHHVYIIAKRVHPVNRFLGNPTEKCQNLQEKLHKFCAKSVTFLQHCCICATP